MQKLLLLCITALIGASLTSCIAPVQATGPTPSATTGQGASTSSLGDIIGNIISSVTGSITTTEANLIGTWTYTEPCVQFESENLLTQAGGGAAATQVEAKLDAIYKMVGINPGSLVFTFAKDGSVSYTLGGKTFNGTYTFDSKAKTVTITGQNGRKLTAHVTISGPQMSLCFDSTKALDLFNAYGTQLGNISSTIGSIAALTQNFKGMKTGFKFKR